MQRIAEHCSSHATKINVIGLIGGTFMNPNLSFCWVFTHIRIKIVQRNGREDCYPITMNFWDHFELLSHNHVTNKPGKWPTGGCLPWCDQTWANKKCGSWSLSLMLATSDSFPHVLHRFKYVLNCIQSLQARQFVWWRLIIHDYPYLLMVNIHWLSIVSWNS